MKILFVAPRYHTNQTYIVKTLREKGHNVYFFVSRIGKTEDHSIIRPKIIKVNFLSFIIMKLFGSGPNNKNYFPNFYLYWKEIKVLKPDIIIIRNHGKIFTYMTALYGLIINSKIIFYEQVNTKYLKNRKNILVDILRKIKFYLPLMTFKAAWMTPLLDKEEKYLPKKCFYVPFAVPVKNKKNKINEPVKFLMVAKYQYLKRHGLLLKALNNLKDKYKFQLTFIGEIDDRNHQIASENFEVRKNVEEEVINLGLNDRIDFIDNLEFKKMPDVYQKHDIFILPTCNDNAAISVLEANGQGLPVICSDMSGTDVYIKENYNGFVFPTDNLDILCEKIEIFLKNPLLIYEISQNAINYAQENFSSETYYYNFKELLKNQFNIRL